MHKNLSTTTGPNLLVLLLDRYASQAKKFVEPTTTKVVRAGAARLSTTIYGMELKYVLIIVWSSMIAIYVSLFQEMQHSVTKF